MKLAITSVVHAPRERVYAALVDPTVIQRCIPGCESLTEVAPDTFEAKLKIGVAGLKGSYSGSASIRDRNPPESLTLAMQGKGGPGFVRGTAAIALSAEGEGGRDTRVDCQADVQVGGIIAAVGSRLIEAAAKKMADDFFAQLSEQLRT